MANKLGLESCGSFLPYEGVDIGLLTTSSYDREELSERLNDLFPQGFHAMEYGMEKPEKIAILTGSGQSAVDQILESGADTLITGELKQHHFNLAQELNLTFTPADIMQPKGLEWTDLPAKFLRNLIFPTNLLRLPVLSELCIRRCEYFPFAIR